MGAAARYAATEFKAFPDIWKFPGTLSVNLLGCLLIGIACGMAKTLGVPREVYLFAVTGLLGGFTTFSTFALDNVVLTDVHGITSALAYIFVSVAGGVMLCAAGLFATQWIIRNLTC